MIDTRVIRILQHLQNFGFTSITNIAPIIDEIFPYNQNDSAFDFNINQRNVREFIIGLRSNELIYVDGSTLQDEITTFEHRLKGNSWYLKGLEVSISKGGLDVLSEYRHSQLVEESHISAMNVNASILQTNTSVQDTNRTVSEVSKTQRNLAYISLFIVAISTVYLILTFYKSDSPILKSIDTKLQNQEILLDSMRRYQKGIDSSLRIMAKKTSLKKP
jgi:hypothetical protein